jgi:glycosyltransferase involved in cell wall biosynthesis
MSARLRVCLFDLFEGEGHRYYTAPLAHALAAREELEVSLVLHASQPAEHYPAGIERLSLAAPTGLRGAQLARFVAQPWMLARLAGFLSRRRPHILHQVFFHPWFLALAPLLSRVTTLVTTLHDVTLHPGEESWVNRSCHAMTRRASRLVVVHGDRLAAEAAGLYSELEGRMTAIPHGHFEALRLREPGAPVCFEPQTFLFFGRMVAYKGLGVALAAFAELRIDYPDARLVVAGAGEEELERHRGELSGAGVELLPRRIDDAELEALMGRCCAVLVPYLQASGSGVVATAAAYERPCLASRLPGLEDMIEHGRTGWLAPASDARALTALMARAIQQPEALQAMGRAARRHAREAWSWELIAAHLSAAYRASSS